MKYILMMQFPLSSWKSQRFGLWPEKDQKAHYDFLKRFNRELMEAGEFVRTEGLGGPEQMKIVRATKTGAPAVTDGPFPESKEVLAGYWVIDVETPQRAYELAARASAAPGPGGKPLDMPIEVHPVMFTKASGDDPTSFG
ncbi:MAG TPA: YciI family protein [Gammaproteobacteria bacterium]|nr:YciI family protein [Gammaproteobacteria bacterium]